MKPPLPGDFHDALREAGLDSFFADCTAAHQNEYLKWIGEAKRTETRRTRMAQAIKMIAAKKKQAESD